MLWTTIDSWHSGHVGESAVPALVNEAMKRASLVWLSYAGTDRPRAVWHAWNDDVAYVVSGGHEQPLPGILAAGQVVVTARAQETRARLLSFVAAAETLIPWTDEWHTAVHALCPERLNAVVGEELAKVWAAESTVTRLALTGELVAEPAAHPANSLAEQPQSSAAATRSPTPWVTHRRARRTPRL